MSESEPQIRSIQIIKISSGSAAATSDQVAIEAPLEIRIKREKDPMSKAVAVTMRTPGHDIELALGFLFTEGILKHTGQVKQASVTKENTIEITVSDDVNTDMKNADRNFYTTSSCGVCGKASIEAIKVSPEHNSSSSFYVRADKLGAFPQEMNAIQSAFKATGGIHASALFDADGKLQLIKEDVGRHNALDKMIGHYFKKGSIPLNNSVLLLSGRASFELVQKAAMSGIQIVAAVGAPSSLAIDLAIEHNITLVGFLKHDQFNIYSCENRIIK